VRILYLSPTASLGGAERVLLAVLAAARAARPAPALRLILPDAGPLAERAAALGVETEVLPLPGDLAGLGDSGLRDRRGPRAWWGLFRRLLLATPAARRYARTLAAAVRAWEPDLVHSNGIKTHLLAWLAGGGGAPVLWHAHDFYGARPAVAHLLRRAARAAAGAVAVSEAVARDLAGLSLRLPVWVVPNAVDLERFAPGPGDARWLDAAAGFPAARGSVARVGLVATYARWKGHDVFLQAAARVLARPLPLPVRFYVVGGPIYQTAGSQFTEAELRGEARRLGVADRVGFVPFQADPAGCYRALDVVVHASTRPEPFGLTIAEAMACGRAVVAVPDGGAAEVFTDGHNAVGVTGGDAGALAAAITDLVGDPERRRRLGEEARRTAVARFGAPRFSAQIGAAYAAALRGPHRPAVFESPAPVWGW
jgi:glycosyltransferase involved in cell wall biosynthesis